MQLEVRGIGGKSPGANDGLGASAGGAIDGTERWLCVESGPLHRVSSVRFSPLAFSTKRIGIQIHLAQRSGQRELARIRSTACAVPGPQRRVPRGCRGATGTIVMCLPVTARRAARRGCSNIAFARSKISVTPTRTALSPRLNNNRLGSLSSSAELGVLLVTLKVTINEILPKNALVLLRQ